MIVIGRYSYFVFFRGAAPYAPRVIFKCEMKCESDFYLLLVGYAAAK